MYYHNTRIRILGVNAMDLHPEDIIISIINIVILFFLLRLILWKRVITFLRERTERIDGEMEEAKNQRIEAEAMLSEYNEKFDKIEERGRELMATSQKRANKESEKILADARERTKIMTQEAQAHIAIEKKLALEEAQWEIAELATNMASQILEREVSAADNAHVVDEFFKE